MIARHREAEWISPPRREDAEKRQEKAAHLDGGTVALIHEAGGFLSCGPACYSSDLKHYPIFLNLQDQPVLVVGAGKIALRKTLGLVEAGALVTVVAPRWRPEFQGLPVRRVSRRFRASDLAGASLAFAATNDRETNRRVGLAAQHRGIWANIADAAEECDFVVPARVERGTVQIAIATGGRNPRLSAALRKKLDRIL